MKKDRKNNIPTVITIGIDINISSKEDDFFTIRDTVERVLSRLYPIYDIENLQLNRENRTGSFYLPNILEFIVLNRFPPLEGRKVYFANYRETQGSLNIHFDLVVMFLLGYGGMRETVDYFVEDLGRILNLALSSRNYLLNVKHESNFITNEQLESQVNNLGLSQQLTDDKNSALKTIIIISLLFNFFNLYLISNIEKPLDDLHIKEIIQNEIKNIRIDAIYKATVINAQEIKIDTLRSSKNRLTK